MLEIITCKTCGKRFPNNPDKHHHRDKLCPHCRTPYSYGRMFVSLPSFRGIRQSLQKAFQFFPDASKKTICYVCPNCGSTATSESELKFRKYPDKTKTVIVKGIEQVVVLSYRGIPTCKTCNTHMVRKRVN